MPQKAVWMPVLRTAMFHGWDRIKLKKNPIQQLFQVVAWGGNTVTEFFPLSMQKERALTWPVQAAGCRDHELGSQQSKTPLWSVNIWCLWVCIYRKQLTCWFCTLVAFFFPAANLTACSFHGQNILKMFVTACLPLKNPWEYYKLYKPWNHWFLWSPIPLDTLHSSVPPFNVQCSLLSL